MKWLLAIPLLALPTSALTAVAEGAFAPAVSGSTPIQFRADRMIARQDGTIELEQHVRVWQEQTVLEADRMEIVYAQDSRTVQQIRAIGNVVVSEPGRRATAAQGVFDVPQNRIILTGRPVLRDGENELTGERMTIWRDDGRVEVEQARARLHPDQLPEVLSTPGDTK